VSTPAAHVENWTTRRLLNWMTEAFTKKGLDSPRLSAELLLTHVLGCDRLRLYMDADRPAAPLERDTLRELVGRALKHEPIDYLVGEKWFFGMAFHVSPAVLVPRPSTETIVENVLLHARAEPGFGGKTGEGVRFADVCTGSGCIAVALLKHLPGAAAVATDISPDALAVAQRNADRHGVRPRVEFLQGDLLAPLRDAAGVSTAATTDLHYLLANPPYIPDHEWDAVPPNVKDYEPHAALRGGADGLMFVRPLIEGAAEFLRPGGVLMVEVAACTSEQAAALASAQPQLERVRVLNDLEGLPRVVVATRKK
jgi:release factor glutamine methyltransferase